MSGDKEGRKCLGKTKTPEGLRKGPSVHHQTSASYIRYSTAETGVRARTQVRAKATGLPSTALSGSELQQNRNQGRVVRARIDGEVTAGDIVNTKELVYAEVAPLTISG